VSQSALVARAEALIDLLRPAEAIDLVNQALSGDPHAAELHAVAARAYLALDRPGQALTAATRALKLDPEYAPAALLVALAYNALARFDDALTWSQKARELAPYDSAAHAISAQLEAGRGKRRLALELAEHAVSLDPDSAFVHLSYGVVLERTGQYAAAEQALRHALSIDPHDAIALSTLGQVLAERGRGRDAAELLQLAARSDIRDESIHQDMVRYTRRAGWGFATVPVMVLLLVMIVFAQEPTSRIVEGVLLVLLIALRLQRLWRFPPEARRLILRRSGRRDAFEIQGAPGWRPWWWHLIVRIPPAARVAVIWAIVAVAALDRDSESGAPYLWALVACAITARWLRVLVRARRTLPMYRSAMP
jgi:tetratricopeptide (TPR) repeat protein